MRCLKFGSALRCFLSDSVLDCERPGHEHTVTRGMTIGHVNSTRVKHFVGTKLLRNAGNVSSAVTHDTMEVPASQQNMTQSKRRKVNVPPDPTVLFDTWPVSSIMQYFIYFISCTVAEVLQ